MTSPAVFWPTALGVAFLIAGIYTYGREPFSASWRDGTGLVALGPVFVAAAIATFGGEHFTAAKGISQLVPKWLPARLFITYFVGVAFWAAALSFVARRCIRWSSFFLGILFALFVLLMDLPASLKRPHVILSWSLAARQATYSIGAFALFATEMRMHRPEGSSRFAAVARFWTAGVLIFYGAEHFLHPQYWPGVPDNEPMAAWVPFPLAIAYVTGIFLIVSGIGMFVRKYAGSAGTLAGLLMLVLTVVLYVPKFFLARTVPEHVDGFNFVFDTLLFSGMLFLVSKAILVTEAKPAAISQTAR